MKTIEFYKAATGKCPVEEFLDKLSDTQVAKITRVLKLVKELDRVPTKYFKKLKNTDDIWEVRASSGNNIFRILGFIHNDSLVVLTNSFQKKTQKTPASEIDLAEKRKKNYLKRRNKNG